MLGFRRGATISGEGLKVVGNVTAEGRVEIYGRLDGEVQCKSLLLSRKAHLVGAVTAEHATINGTVEGPIHAAHVRLKSRAHVVGDIQPIARHQEGRTFRGPVSSDRKGETGRDREGLEEAPVRSRQCRS